MADVTDVTVRLTLDEAVTTLTALTHVSHGIVTPEHRASAWAKIERAIGVGDDDLGPFEPLRTVLMRPW
jgi:hypothetical protein